MPARERLSWFRFNPGDFISDPAVQAMTDEQFGKYVRVLCALYQRNSGAATEDEVRAWARCSETEWQDHRAALARAFKVGRSGRWTQKRVELEVRAAQNRVEKATESGRAGGRASAKKRGASLGLLEQPYSDAEATS